MNIQLFNWKFRLRLKYDFVPWIRYEELTVLVGSSRQTQQLTAN